METDSLQKLITELRSIVFELNSLNSKIQDGSIFRNGLPFIGSFSVFEKKAKEGAVILKNIQSFSVSNPIIEKEINTLKNSFLFALQEYQKQVACHNGAIDTLNKLVK